MHIKLTWNIEKCKKRFSVIIFISVIFLFLSLSKPLNPNS